MEDKVMERPCDIQKTPYVVIGVGHMGDRVVMDFTGRGYQKTSFVNYPLDVDGLDGCIVQDDKKIIVFPLGLGGSSGDEAIRLLESMGDDRKCLVIGVLARPFSFEGENRRKRSQRQLERLSRLLDTMFVIDDDMLVPKEYDISLYELFERSDSAMEMVLSSLLDLVEQKGSVTPDEERIRTLLRDGGTSFAGFGRCMAKDELEGACMTSLYSPLVKDMMDRAETLVLCLSGRSLTLTDGQEMARIAKGVTGGRCKVLFSIDDSDSSSKEIWVTSLVLNVKKDGESGKDGGRDEDQQVYEEPRKESVETVSEESEQQTGYDPKEEDEIVVQTDIPVDVEDGLEDGPIEEVIEEKPSEDVSLFQGKIDELEKALSEKNDEVEDLKGMLEQAYGQIDTLKRQLRALEELEDDSSSEEAESLRIANETLEDRCDFLERRIKGLVLSNARKTKRLEGIIDNQRKANSALREMLRRLAEEGSSNPSQEDSNECEECPDAPNEEIVEEAEVKEETNVEESSVGDDDSIDHQDDSPGGEDAMDDGDGQDSPPVQYEEDAEEDEPSLVDELMELLD